MAENNPKISQVQLPSGTLYDIHGKTADKLENPITITVTGDATGSVSIDGSEDVSLELSIATDKDENVKQSGDSSSDWRGAILSKNSASSSTDSIEKEVTDQVYTSDNVKIQPSTGTIRATVYRFGDDAQLEYDTTTKAIKFSFIS